MIFDGHQAKVGVKHVMIEEIIEVHFYWKARTRGNLLAQNLAKIVKVIHVVERLLLLLYWLYMMGFKQYLVVDIMRQMMKNLSSTSEEQKHIIQKVMCKTTEKLLGLKSFKMELHFKIP